MGGEGAVKLSTKFTQTALSARVEPQDERRGGERAGEDGRETDRGT